MAWQFIGVVSNGTIRAIGFSNWFAKLFFATRHESSC
jgi:hypothetical protein